MGERVAMEKAWLCQGMESFERGSSLKSLSGRAPVERLQGGVMWSLGRG